MSLRGSNSHGTMVFSSSSSPGTCSSVVVPMEALDCSVSRGGEMERRVNLDDDRRTNWRFENHHRHGTGVSARPTAKRRPCSPRRVAWVPVTLALLFLFMSKCSGFVVSVARDRPTAILLENDFRSGRTPRFCATQTEPTWREKLEEKESPLDRNGSFHPGEHLFVMQVDDDQSDAPSVDEEDAVDERGSATRGEAPDDEDDDELAEKRRKAQARAALLAKRGGARKSSSRTPKQTSVGARRVGSATLGRRGGTATSQIMDGLRKTAQGTSSPSGPKKEVDDKMDPPTTSARISQGVVQTAIEDLLARDEANLTAAFSAFGRNMGLLKESPFVKEGITLRLANPNDDVDIANLRLSVFSDFTPDLQNQFCARSCQAIAARRLRGATCFVATAPCRDFVEGGRSEVILGSAECSSHEFVGTRLGRRRLPNSILYVTELAVTPSARRRRIGSRLLDAIFCLAQNRCVETLYLHCDVENRGALRLYEKAGYSKILSDDPMYTEFTKSLNLHPGATKGREHFLMCKNVFSDPIWLKDTHNSDCSSDRLSELVGVLGFEIPA